MRSPGGEGGLVFSRLLAEEEESSQRSDSAVFVNGQGEQEKVLVVDVANKGVSRDQDVACLCVVDGLRH